MTADGGLLRADEELLAPTTLLTRVFATPEQIAGLDHFDPAFEELQFRFTTPPTQDQPVELSLARLCRFRLRLRLHFADPAEAELAASWSPRLTACLLPPNERIGSRNSGFQRRACCGVAVEAVWSPGRSDLVEFDLPCDLPWHVYSPGFFEPALSYESEVELAAVVPDEEIHEVVLPRLARHVLEEKVATPATDPASESSESAAEAVARRRREREEDAARLPTWRGKLVDGDGRPVSGSLHLLDLDGEDLTYTIAETGGTFSILGNLPPRFLVVVSRIKVDEEETYTTAAPEPAIAVDRWPPGETGVITVGAAIPVAITINIGALPMWKRGATLRLSIHALNATTANAPEAPIHVAPWRRDTSHRRPIRTAEIALTPGLYECSASGGIIELERKRFEVRAGDESVTVDVIAK